MTKTKAILLKITPPQFLTLGFIIIISIGSLLLSLPAASTDGIRTPFIDALFTATSAVCVTGLVVVDTGTHFTIFGQVVILTLMQIGGLGFMTMATMLALAFRKRISLRERLLLQETMNQASLEGIVRFIRRVLVYAFVIEIVGALLLAMRFSLTMPIGRALYLGIFHSISMFTNAGFDVLGTVNGPFSSFVGHVDDPIVNFVIIMLIFLGGIGFIVLAELWDFSKVRKLSLHSKVVLTTSGVLFLAGAVLIFIFEFTNARTLEPLDITGKLYSSLFQSISPRSGGASTLDIGAMRSATQFLIVLLMFIGASPGSAGGGIKVTTFAILVGAVIAMIRGKEDVVFFNRRLAKDRVHKALTISIVALSAIVLFTMLISATENVEILTAMFEVTSAFGTTGLSMGLTPHLTTLGKVLIITMMFIGRLGPLTLAFTLAPGEKELYRYPEGKIMIG
ncbi:TrkH family potassium uptake protein [Paenibacillus radicis (ex Gao et al. 2016)]|uniref:K+ transporter Trk n=1 Tax=Paenibacillus radicis (ex Gao et al. 2016) TaxID=1737354 RepID=A0A917HG30_9BACL|nr:TrkH family potassium uptake protein [Paenibacillus radicis (ex Gao et al. 2016)]GGG77457.1 K+ transporter Trk [Paenibacillus radicis (ex Gao et al. 2016)]